MTVTLKNVGSTVFEDRFDGQTYRIKPGAAVLVPKAVAKHWIGDWELPEPSRSLDRERARFRRSGKPLSLVLVEDDELEEEEVSPPTPEEEETLKSLRKGAAYVFPDGTKISKKVEALAYLREHGAAG